MNEKDDIIFIQEFTDNKYIKVEELFKKDNYTIFRNSELKIKSSVVAIALNGTPWEIVKPEDGAKSVNKYIEMKLKKELRVIGFHNTNEVIKEMINEHFKKGDNQVILGDFNDKEWIISLDSEENKYRDLVTDDMITFKPAQTAIDRIFVKKEQDDLFMLNDFEVRETYTSDHNILTLLLNENRFF